MKHSLFGIFFVLYQFRVVFHSPIPFVTLPHPLLLHVCQSWSSIPSQSTHALHTLHSVSPIPRRTFLHSIGVSHTIAHIHLLSLYTPFLIDVFYYFTCKPFLATSFLPLLLYMWLLTLSYAYQTGSITYPLLLLPHQHIHSSYHSSYFILNHFQLIKFTFCPLNYIHTIHYTRYSHTFPYTPKAFIPVCPKACYIFQTIVLIKTDLSSVPVLCCALNIFSFLAFSHPLVFNTHLRYLCSFVQLICFPSSFHFRSTSSSPPFMTGTWLLQLLDFTLKYSPYTLTASRILSNSYLYSLIITISSIYSRQHNLSSPTRIPIPVLLSPVSHLSHSSPIQSLTHLICI